MPCFVIDNRALKNHKQVVVFENLRTCKRLLGARCFLPTETGTILQKGISTFSK
jgi:hypothetical protein